MLIVVGAPVAAFGDVEDESTNVGIFSTILYAFQKLRAASYELRAASYEQQAGIIVKNLIFRLGKLRNVILKMTSFIFGEIQPTGGQANSQLIACSRSRFTTASSSPP